MASTRCYLTSARLHGAIVYCLNSGAPTPRLAAIMVKESRYPIDNRRRLSRKNPVASEERALDRENLREEPCPGSKEGEESPKGRRTDIGVKRKEKR
ncbi:hypothetical protein TNCV_2175311 [Trichonephila clavipes]|uniref:Uncharacterized protein n=1 Tax=Trichonephila clavipes TaxID=2585209 RepID=A0A8X6S584_TRICX|nr:hypothetical protein TNCV_2175311 [Trichonephila clavipes]